MGHKQVQLQLFPFRFFLNHDFFSNFVNFWSFQKCVNNINQKHENSLRNILIFCKMLSCNPPSHLLPIPNLNANPSAALGGGYLQYPQDLGYLIPWSVNSYMPNLNLSVSPRAALSRLQDRQSPMASSGNSIHTLNPNTTWTWAPTPAPPRMTTTFKTGRRFDIPWPAE